MRGSTSFERNGPSLSDPGKPIRMRRAFPSGGTSDIHARHVALSFGPVWAHLFLVDNSPRLRPSSGAMAVVRPKPDGHTLLYTLTLNGAGQSAYFVLRKALRTTRSGISRRSPSCMQRYDGARVSTRLPVKQSSRTRSTMQGKNPGKLNFRAWVASQHGQLNGRAAEGTRRDRYRARPVQRKVPIWCRRWRPADVRCIRRADLPRGPWKSWKGEYCRHRG